MKQRLLSLVVLFAVTVSIQAQTVWNGPLYTFTKAAFANPTLASSQDRITSNTWITRGNTQGIYNIFSEAGYVHGFSPANTEWATGSLANYASLTYQRWEDWAGGAPNVPSIVGVPAVLHIISQNIYIGITFTSWGVGGGSGGVFSYQRTTPSVTTPVKLASFNATKESSGVQLSWTTASEENTASFNIERSADGRDFASIGSVLAAGFSSEQKAYGFIDALPLVSNFYRLRMIDKDGKTSYSNVVSFKTDRRMKMEIFPVPAREVLHVQTNNASPFALQIVDASGRIRKSVCLPAGNQSLTLDLSGLKRGIYFLKSGEESRTFLKE